MKRLFLLALPLLSLACSPTLTLVSPAPPNRVVSIDREIDGLTISEGVAVAADCFHWRTGTCDGMRATTDDPKVARVLPAHIAKLRGFGLSERSATSLAVVGVSPGRTTLHVTVGSGATVSYVVTVVPAR